MNWNRAFAVLITMSVLVGCGAAVAADVDIHGSVSQGWIKTTEYDYLVTDSKNGSAEFNEMVLNFNSQVSDNLRVGVQFLGRDFGDQGNNEMLVDWALGDYRLDDKLGLRFGKFKIPYGLYNKTRDIDFLRTSVMLPQGVYQEMFREVLGGVQGVSAYGTIPGRIGWSSFEYEVFAGTVDLNRTKFGSNTMGKYINGAMLNYLGTLNGAMVPASMGNVQYAGTVDAVYGYGLTYNSPVEGLRLNHTLLATKLDLQSTYLNVGEGSIPAPLGGGEVSLVNMDAELDVEYVMTVGAEYMVGNLTLAAELQQAIVEFDPTVTTDFIPDDPALDPYEFVDNNTYFQHRRAYYGMANYRVSDLLEVGGYYSYYTEEWREADSDVPASYQKDIAFTTRFDVSPGWTLKAEYHLIKGLADLDYEMHPEVFYSPTANELEDTWSMFTIKTTYSF